MLKEIDANPASETTFFLYRVKNGQAVDMVNTLNGLFQQTSRRRTRSSSTLTSKHLIRIEDPSGGVSSGGAVEVAAAVERVDRADLVEEAVARYCQWR